MTRELYIDNQRVDLPEDVRFQLTFQIADFGELKPRGSGSNTIKLPKTPRNVAIFDNCNFVQVNSRFPYLLHSAYYREDGWLIFRDATVYMLAITQTDFEIQCVWGNSTEIRRLKSIDMGNVAGLGNVNYQPVTFGYIETGMKGIYGNVEAFQLATKGNLKSAYTRGLLNIKLALDNIGGFNAEYSQSVFTYLDHLYAFPAVSKAKIGYKNEVFYGDIKQGYGIGETTFKWDSNTKTATLSEDPAERRKAFMKIGNTTRTITTQGGTPFDGVVAPFTLPGGWYDIVVEVSEIEFQNPAGKPPYYDDRIDEAVFVIGQVLAGNDTSKYTVESDSSLVINIDSGWKFEGRVYTGKKRIYIDDTEIDMGNDVKAVPELYCAVWPTHQNNPQNGLYNFGVIAKVKITMSAVQALTEVDINMPDETAEGVKNYITIAMVDLLRGTSAYDFITQAVINAGAIFDSKDGKNRVYTYNDIAENTAQMLDWSDKLVYIKQESTFNQSGGSQNEVKYKQDEYYNGFGDGSFADPLAQQLQKESQTVVENSLFGFNNGFFQSGYKNNLFIPFVLEKTDKEGVKTYEYKDRGWQLLRLTDNGSGNLQNKDGKDVKPAYAVKRPDNRQPTFANITASNWSEFIAIKTNYRKATALFMLSAQDIAELDFKKPIYLRQYAQSYIVTKVNYQPKGSTVEMILVR